jgi:hypothetical protein
MGKSSQARQANLSSASHATDEGGITKAMVSRILPEVLIIIDLSASDRCPPMVVSAAEVDSDKRPCEGFTGQPDVKRLKYGCSLVAIREWMHALQGFSSRLHVKSEKKRNKGGELHVMVCSFSADE